MDWCARFTGSVDSIDTLRVGIGLDFPGLDTDLLISRLSRLQPEYLREECFIGDTVEQSRNRSCCRDGKSDASDEDAVDIGPE